MADAPARAGQNGPQTPPATLETPEPSPTWEPVDDAGARSTPRPPGPDGKGEAPPGVGTGARQPRAGTPRREPAYEIQTALVFPDAFRSPMFRLVFRSQQLSRGEAERLYQNHIQVDMNHAGQQYLCGIPRRPAHQAPVQHRRSPESDHAIISEALARLERLSRAGCLDYKDRFWDYQFCHMAHVKQYFMWPDSPEYASRKDLEYTLGVYADDQTAAHSDVRTSARQPKSPISQLTPGPAQGVHRTALPAGSELVETDEGGRHYLRQMWGLGDLCEEIGDYRTIEVQYHCCDEEHVAHMREYAVCRYSIVVHTPLMCFHSIFESQHHKASNEISCVGVAPAQLDSSSQAIDQTAQGYAAPTTASEPARWLTLSNIFEAKCASPVNCVLPPRGSALSELAPPSKDASGPVAAAPGSTGSKSLLSDRLSVSEWMAKLADLLANGFKAPVEAGQQADSAQNAAGAGPGQPQSGSRKPPAADTQPAKPPAEKQQLVPPADLSDKVGVEGTSPQQEWWLRRLLSQVRRQLGSVRRELLDLLTDAPRGQTVVSAGLEGALSDEGMEGLDEEAIAKADLHDGVVDPAAQPARHPDAAPTQDAVDAEFYALIDDFMAEIPVLIAKFERTGRLPRAPARPDAAGKRLLWLLHFTFGDDAVAIRELMAQLKAVLGKPALLRQDVEVLFLHIVDDLDSTGDLPAMYQRWSLQASGQAHGAEAAAAAAAQHADARLAQAAADGGPAAAAFQDGADDDHLDVLAAMFE
ncbi:Protein OS-9 [Polyrhizophydium stewartii]|uniref:Protein OS-9 homolog n=1 Tax=Polyrhizophydium stewartii TaxID=2732419 RepID=A0ABR4MWV6_9FUNG